MKNTYNIYGARYGFKGQYRDALINFGYKRSAFNVAASLALNDGEKTASCVHAFARNFRMNAIKSLKWFRRPIDRKKKIRVTGIGFCEHLQTNAHAHLLLKITQVHELHEWQWRFQEAALKQAWKNCAEKGSSTFKRLPTGKERKEWVDYITKEFLRPSFVEDYFLI